MLVFNQIWIDRISHMAIVKFYFYFNQTINLETGKRLGLHIFDIDRRGMWLIIRCVQMLLELTIDMAKWKLFDCQLMQLEAKHNEII